MESLEPARPWPVLARRRVPLDAAAFGGAALGRRERAGGAPPRIDVADTLLDRRAHLTGLGVEDLMAHHERVALDGHDAAGDVHHVADTQLADVPHVAVGGHERAAPAPGIAEPEIEGVEQPEEGVAEAGEVERDREVIVVVDLPAIDHAAVRLEPAAHEFPLVSVSGSGAYAYTSPRT